MLYNESLDNMMEEHRRPIQIQLTFSSKTITQLTIHIQNINREPLLSSSLKHQQLHLFDLHYISSGIYICFIHSESQIQQTLEYRFDQTDNKQREITVDRSYYAFDVHVVFNIHETYSFAELDEADDSIKVKAKQAYCNIKQKVMAKLIMDKIIIEQNAQNKGSYVRKNKGKKNLTTILFGKKCATDNSNHSTTDLFNKIKTENQSHQPKNTKLLKKPSFILQQGSKKSHLFSNKMHVIQIQQKNQVSISQEYDYQDQKQDKFVLNIRVKTTKKPLKKKPISYKMFLQKLEKQTRKSLIQQKQAFTILRRMITEQSEIRTTKKASFIPRHHNKPLQYTTASCN